MGPEIGLHDRPAWSGLRPRERPTPGAVTRLAVGGGAAAKLRSDRSKGSHALSRQTIAPTTTAPFKPGIDVKIPLPGFGDMLVDEARGRLYISGGKAPTPSSSPTSGEATGGLSTSAGVAAG